MATHSSILAWTIPQTEEPGGLQSVGSQGVRHDRVTAPAGVQTFKRYYDPYFTNKDTEAWVSLVTPSQN